MKSKIYLKIACLAILFLVLTIPIALASHFRHGTLSWSPAPISGQPNRIEFKSNVAYSCNRVIGSNGYAESIQYGDGTTQFLTPIVTSSNVTENWHYAEAQSSNDFWSAFEKCTQLPELQMLYSPTLPLTHYVMDHGVEIPSTSGVMFNTNT